MEAGQWRVAGHGLPRIAADAAPCRPDRVAAGETPGTESNRGTRTARTGDPRQPAGAWAVGEHHSVRVCASAPHAGGSVFNSLMEQYHYLGYEQPVGEHLKYLVKTASSQGSQVIACLAWQSAPRHLKVRDRFLGWSDEARERNVHLLAYNTRFLILPWVRVEHLASHLLGRLAKIVPQDWQRLYAHPIHWLETFVDTSRFRGICYRAANWQVIGATSGRGHRAPSFEQSRPVKQMLGLPLHRRFRELLSA